MILSSSYFGTGRVISTQTDEELDLRSHGVFVDACRLAKYPEPSTIDVNLTRTRTIRASGMAMLLTLQKITGWERSRIRLLNCNPEIRKQLVTSPMGQQFQVV